MISKYNYEKYWNKRGKHYLRNFAYNDLFLLQEKLLLELLSALRLSFNSVFEFGCGFGRITKLVNENFYPKVYDALDISEEQIKNARQLNKDNINFIHGDFLEHKTSRTYDLVLSCEALMHIPPELITKFTKKLLDLSNKYMVCIEGTGTGKLAKHNFSHDYKNIFKDYYLMENKINNQSIFFISK